MTPGEKYATLLRAVARAHKAILKTHGHLAAAPVIDGVNRAERTLRLAMKKVLK